MIQNSRTVTPKIRVDSASIISLTLAVINNGLPLELVSFLVATLQAGCNPTRISTDRASEMKMVLLQTACAVVRNNYTPQLHQLLNKGHLLVCALPGIDSDDPGTPPYVLTPTTNTLCSGYHCQIVDKLQVQLLTS